MLVQVYGNAGNNQSLTRDPDLTGDYVEHSGATGANGALFSPGTQTDGSQFAGCPVPNLSMTKSAEPVVNVQPNGLVTYTIVLESIGAAESVNITDTLPTEVEFAYWIEQSGATVANDEITFAGTVSATNPITISFAVTNLETAGGVQNVAEYSSSAESGSDSAIYSVFVDLIINEFQADPDSGPGGDANGDGGNGHFSEDEFVEIVNNSDLPINLTGWTFADNAAIRHEFPAGTILPPHCAIVIFGGGTPTGAFGNALVQTASTGALSLNNSGDDLTLNNGLADVVSYTYGSEAGNNQSLTRDPDLTGGTFVEHSTATDSGGALFSPGTKIDGTSFCDGIIPIPIIQGDSDASPFDGVVVTTVGVVVADFQEDGLSGFNIQDPYGDGNDATSDGIFVFTDTTTVDVNIGDIVTVTAEVDEFFDLTELTNVQSVVVGGNMPLTPTKVTLPLDNTQREALEGMLIELEQELTVTELFELGRFGQIMLSSEGRAYQFTHSNAPDPTGYAAHLEAFANSTIKIDDKQTTQKPRSGHLPIT